MIVQPALLITKHQNQPSRECLYAWYPEAICNSETGMPPEPRDLYIHCGLDRDLLEQNPSNNKSTSTFNNNNTSVELLQRYKQSIVPSDRAYHSTETINEALNPPWALHYQIKRRPATPNLPSNSNDMSNHEEPPRRLKSAPVTRSLPPTAILTIPEPRFIVNVIPTATTNQISTPTPLKTRASSAKARLNSSNENQQQRDIKSASVSRPKTSKKLSDEEIQEIFKRVYGNQIQRPSSQQTQPIQIIYTQAAQPSPVAPPPIYVYQRSASWCGDDTSSNSVRKSIETTDVALNPHHVHRPGHIAVQNTEKPAVLRENAALRKAPKYRRRYHHSHGKRTEPLLAVTPIPKNPKLSLEIDGVKLKYDPKLSLDDKSPAMTKYFIDGRLYLIKDQCYNVIDNIDPSILEKYNQKLTRPASSKHYQTIPIENFQLRQPSPALHYNGSERQYHNASPQRVHRFVIDPNIISENMNVNRMSLSKRPPTATVYA